MSETTYDLIPSLNIQAFLQKRQDLLDRFALIQDVADDMRKLQHDLGGEIRLEYYDGRGRASHESVIDYNGYGRNSKRDYNQEIRDAYKKAVDRHGWRTLMEKSGALTYMDSKARDDWDKSLSDGTYPELTYENIKATFQGLYESRQDIFHRSVINVFKSMSWNYKTNSPWKFGKRLIKRGVYRHSIRLRELDDLTRAFCVLDGKPEPAREQSWEFAIGYEQHTGYKENEYLSLRWHKNGNGHITFKRLDLVEQLNKILHLYYPHAIPYDEREAA